MNDKRNIIDDNRLIEAAVRRAVGVRIAHPSLRSLRRSCAVYANVIAAAVACGLPTAGAVRHAASSAMTAFEASVRNFGDLSVPSALETPVDLGAVTETTAGTPEVAVVPTFVAEEPVRAADTAPVAAPEPEVTDVPELRGVAE